MCWPLILRKHVRSSSSLNFATDKEGQVTLPLSMLDEMTKNISGEMVPAKRWTGIKQA